MNLGARTAMWSGKRMPTARNYVQDGLIAMWDGIENAGWGVLNPNATEWVDLIGGLICKKKNRGEMEWKSNGCYLTSEYFEGTINNAILQAFLDEAITIEVVLDAQNTNSGHAFSIGYNVRNEVWVSKNGRPSLSYGKNSWTNYLSTGSLVANKLLSVTIVIEGVNGKKYVNANLDASQNNLVLEATPIEISLVRLFGDRAFIGLGCCVRIYNRVLTDKEIAANYAIDKARFGLT